MIPSQICNECKRDLPLTSFSKCSDRKNGVLGRCRECRGNAKKARLRTPEGKAYEQRYAPARRVNVRLRQSKKRDEINAKTRAYYQKHKERLQEQRRARYAYNHSSHKLKANHLLQSAVRRGKIVKPKYCERCSKEVPSLFLHGHHEDYSKPLEVQWLCAGCHGFTHRKTALTAADAWLRQGGGR
jgi:hypothetical protein